MSRPQGVPLALPGGSYGGASFVGTLPLARTREAHTHAYTGSTHTRRRCCSTAHTPSSCDSAQHFGRSAPITTPSSTLHRCSSTRRASARRVHIVSRGRQHDIHEEPRPCKPAPSSSLTCSPKPFASPASSRPLTRCFTTTR